jgi:GNAT superfamily N-acetyltransferase
MHLIRPATPGDASALEMLCAGLFREHEARHPDAYPPDDPLRAAAHYAGVYRHRLAGDPSCLVWLAVDRAPVGFLAAEVWTRAVGQPTTVCFVEWWYVLPEARGQGIGRALEARLGAELQARGVTHVELQSVPSDRQWQRRGWRVASVRYVRPVAEVLRDLAAVAAGDAPPEEPAP